MSNRPAKGTPEYELWTAAIEVAAYPPVYPRKATCVVSSKRIQRLRDALEACGIDWHKVKESS